MVTDEQTPVPKRKCPDNALLRSGRYSISAAVFERMQRNAHGHEELTPERIYPIVHQWFENRRDRVGTCPLDVRTVVNDSLLPEVFGWPSWHRRKFDGTRHSDQLWQHTCGVLQRPTTATNQSTTSKEDTVSSTSTDKQSIGPSATSSFLRMPVSSSSIRGPISNTQQEKDIRRLCEVTFIPCEEWPCQPIDDTPPPASVLRQWSALADRRRWKVHQLVKSMGWSDPVDCYLLVSLACKLDGWEWQTGNNGYPKAAGLCLRRALLSMRGLATSSILLSRVRSALGCTH